MGRWVAHGELLPPGFIQDLQISRSNLHRVSLSGEAIESIRRQLAGSSPGNEKSDNTRFRITGMPGTSRIAFNAKVNINRETARLIVPGLRHVDRVEAGAAFA